MLETGGSVKNALPFLGDGPFFVLNGDGLWRDGPTPMLRRLEGRWDPARMDALLLLHPIHKVIGREATDRGDYFLEPGGRAALSRHCIPGALCLRQRVDLRRASVPRSRRTAPSRC